MIYWRKETLDSYYKYVDYLGTILIVLFAVGLIFKYTPFFVIFGIVAGYLLLSVMYENRIKRRLRLENDPKTIRLFADEKGMIEFNFYNQSKTPVLNGTFKFEFDDQIVGEERSYLRMVIKHRNQYTTSASFVQSGHTSIDLPIIAKHRGVAFIRNISFEFPNPFKFEDITLHYIYYYNTRIVIYPKPIAVGGVDSICQFNPGETRTNFSPFTDNQSSGGIRDYQFTDSIKRINWKASAKAQNLQTNVYPYIMDMSFVFIINLDLVEGMNLVDFSTNFERSLSYTTYLCQYATKKGYPFELYINARKMEKPSFVHVAERSGNAHLAKVLEILSIIRPLAPTYPFNHMLHTIEKNFMKQQSIIIVGNVTQEDRAIIDRWRKEQRTIYHVKPQEEKDVFLGKWTGTHYMH